MRDFESGKEEKIREAFRIPFEEDASKKKVLKKCQTSQRTSFDPQDLSLEREKTKNVATVPLVRISDDDVKR